MKKIKYLLVLVCFMLLPSVVSAATEVSTEEELRSAIKQGGDITLLKDIEITDTLVIDKDVNINGSYSLANNSDNVLIEVNSGNVNLNYIRLYAGVYDTNNHTFKGGTVLVINGGNVVLNGKATSGNNTIEVNGGNLSENGGGKSENASFIYLNGGSLVDSSLYASNENISGKATIEIAKGVSNNNEAVIKNIIFKNLSDRPNSSDSYFYIHDDIKELKIENSRGECQAGEEQCSVNSYKLRLADNVLTVIYTSAYNITATYTSNELKDCMIIYIDNEKYVVGGKENCTIKEEVKQQSVQTVIVPATAAYASLIIVLIGITLIIIATFVIMKFTKNK